MKSSLSPIKGFFAFGSLKLKDLFRVQAEKLKAYLEALPQEKRRKLVIQMYAVYVLLTLATLAYIFFIKL